MKLQHCVSKVTRTLCASALAAGLMLPTGMAFAADVADTSFTLAGVASGDVVHAYQIFDADIDANNNLTFKSKVDGLPAEYDTYDEVAAVSNGRTVADAIAATVIAKSTKSVQETAGSDGKATLTLDSGYYLVTVTSNSGNTKVYQTLLVDATPAVQGGSYVARTLEEAAAKSQAVPVPSKQIVATDNNAGQSTDTYSVGDKAKFTITGTVPSYPADATHATYSITDTPDAGLEVDTSTIVVKCGNDTLSAGADYTLSSASGSFTVAFSKDFILKHPAQSVTIDYSAEVKSVDLASGKVGNTVYGTFTPNPYEDKDVKTDNSQISVDQTYGFCFKKLAAPDNNPLAGAGFTVTDSNGKTVTYMDASGNLHSDGVVTSGADGWVYVNGLKAGTYTVSETSVPTGYQKVTDFSVVLSAATANGDAQATASTTENNFVNVDEKVDAVHGQLPTTGGAGTIALTAGGILLIVGGSIVVMRTRRRD